MCNGGRGSVWGDEKALEADGGDGCRAVSMDLIPLNCALENGREGKFYLGIFYHNKKVKSKKNLMKIIKALCYIHGRIPIKGCTFSLLGG